MTLLRAWDGAKWSQVPGRAYVGGAWVPPGPRVWNGSAWVPDYTPTGPEDPPFVFVDEFDDGGPSSGAGFGTYWDVFGSQGVNCFQALNQLVAGDVQSNNTRNYGYCYWNGYILRRSSFTIGMQIGDSVNSGLETRLYVGRKMTAQSSAQPPTVRATYLDVVSGNAYFRSTNAAGSQTSTTLSGGSSPVGTIWECRVNGASWDIYRNGVFNSTRTDPNGAHELGADVAVGVAICSDRNVIGTRGWGSRVQRWYYSEGAS
jgi:hypothetical protein